MFRNIPACPPESLPEAIERAVADYNRAGFTTFHDGALGPGARAILRACNTLAREGRLNARRYLHFMPPLMDELLELDAWNLPVSGYPHYGGAKSFADGSIQSLSVVLGVPYVCSPGFCLPLPRPVRGLSSPASAFPGRIFTLSRWDLATLPPLFPRLSPSLSSLSRFRGGISVRLSAASQPSLQCRPRKPFFSKSRAQGERDGEANATARCHFSPATRPFGKRRPCRRRFQEGRA